METISSRSNNLEADCAVLRCFDETLFQVKIISQVITFFQKTPTEMILFLEIE